MLDTWIMISFEKELDFFRDLLWGHFDSKYCFFAPNWNWKDLHLLLNLKLLDAPITSIVPLNDTSFSQIMWLHPVYSSGENGEIYLGVGGNMLAHNFIKDQGCYGFFCIYCYVCMCTASPESFNKILSLKKVMLIFCRKKGVGENICHASPCPDWSTNEKNVPKYPKREL